MDQTFEDYKHLIPKKAQWLEREDAGTPPTDAQTAAVDEIDRRWGPDGPSESAFDEDIERLIKKLDPTKTGASIRRFLECPEAWKPVEDGPDMFEAIQEAVHDQWDALARAEFRRLWERFEQKIGKLEQRYGL